MEMVGDLNGLGEGESWEVDFYIIKLFCNNVIIRYQLH